MYDCSGHHAKIHLCFICAADLSELQILLAMFLKFFSSLKKRDGRITVMWEFTVVWNFWETLLITKQICDDKFPIFFAAWCLNSVATYISRKPYSIINYFLWFLMSYFDLCHEFVNIVHLPHFFLCTIHASIVMYTCYTVYSSTFSIIMTGKTLGWASVKLHLYHGENVSI